VGLGAQRRSAWLDKVAWPIWPFGSWPKNRGALLPSTPATCRQNPVSRWPVVGGGVAREQSSRVADRIGGGREGGSPEGLSVVEGISGGGKTLASWSRGHRRGPSGWEEVLGDAMLGVGSRWSERCWSGLSVVAQRRRARWRSGGEAGGGGRKGGCSFYSYQRGGTKAAQVAGGGGKAVGTTKQQRPWSEGCRRGWAPLFGQVPDRFAPHGFTSFQNLSKPPQTCEIKMDALFCSKNSQLLRDSILEYSEQLPQLY
jgi:hypothetical protein